MNKMVTTAEAGEITQLPEGYEGGNMSLAVSLARAEVDQQVATARALPRSIQKAVQSITTLATLDDESAEECIYALPRGGKPIKGPSIRLAEIIASQWGNCRVGARVVHVDRVEKYVEAEGVFHDLESNTATTARVRRRISDKRGNLFNDDMILVTGNAVCSIAKRNAILGGVPKAVWRKAYNSVEQVIAGDSKTLVERRAAAMKAFAAFGIKPEQLFTILDVQGMDDISLEHMITLTGMHSALKSGEETVETMFPRATTPPPAPTAETPKSETKADTETGEILDEENDKEFGAADAMEMGRLAFREKRPNRPPEEWRDGKNDSFAEAFKAGYDAEEADAKPTPQRQKPADNEVKGTSD